MSTPPDEASTTQGFIRYYRSIQQAEGDERLRQTLSAAREVTSHDRQLSAERKASLLDHYDQVEKALFPSENSEPSPPSLPPSNTPEPLSYRPSPAYDRMFQQLMDLHDQRRAGTLQPDPPKKP